MKVLDNIDYYEKYNDNIFNIIDPYVIGDNNISNSSSREASIDTNLLKEYRYVLFVEYTDIQIKTDFIIELIKDLFLSFDLTQYWSYVGEHSVGPWNKTALAVRAPWSYTRM